MINEITLLCEDDPGVELDEARITAIRAPLESAIAAEYSAPSPAVPRWRRPRLLAAAAAVVAVAIALPIGLSSGRAPRQGAQHSPAATGNTILARLASVAIAQPATVPPGPGQYQYTASTDAWQSCGEGTSTSSYCALVPEQREIWIGADGSGRLRETFGTPEFLTPADQAAWQAAGSPALGDGTSDVSFGPDALSDGPANLANVPTDPTALKTAIESRTIESGPPGPGEDFTQIGDLLRETDASPALRSALFQVASEIPGIVQLGSVSDHDGRQGVGIAWDSNGFRDELIFDPTTSALLGEENVALVDNPTGYSGVSAGTLLGWAVYQSSGIVDSTSTTSSGATSPAPPVTCTADPSGVKVVPGSGAGTASGPVPSLTPSGGAGSEPVHCTDAP